MPVVFDVVVLITNYTLRRAGWRSGTQQTRRSGSSSADVTRGTSPAVEVIIAGRPRGGAARHPHPHPHRSAAAASYLSRAPRPTNDDQTHEPRPSQPANDRPLLYLPRNLLSVSLSLSRQTRQCAARRQTGNGHVRSLVDWTALSHRLGQSVGSNR